MAFMARGVSVAQEAEMERRVSVAARNLGDGVQRIVMAAKGSNKGSSKSEWKSQLLQLLGDGPKDERFANDMGDMEILLENSKCEKFVLRCVENELPPNLIHCLRLLRVLELQHASSQKQKGKGEASPISTTGTSKVSKLLCLLCTDPAVGEQLRPHLFGLLALSGASYPPCGVHVAQAASSVIISFSQHCLSTSLVWFLHDRKMIRHMVDDTKELVGMTDVSASSSSQVCLYGKEAERAGLWVVGLQTVVHLVTNSCNHHCLELLKDFESAGGYHVLLYSISNSSGVQTKKLLELVTFLACCKTDMTYTPGEQHEDLDEDDEEARNADAKLATNPAAFDVVEQLMVQNVPLLKEYDDSHGGERPQISTEASLKKLATFSMRTALHVRFDDGGDERPSQSSELAMELLVSTLQMYSDHARNYDIIEGRHNILSYYLLAFPTFEDVSLKVLILKTLEYVLTGVAGTDAMRPLTVASEMFFALCKSLLKGASGIEMDSEEEALIYETLLEDADMMGATIEKMLEFDTRVGPVMVEGGLLSGKLNEVLEQVTMASKKAEETGSLEIAGKKFRQPPYMTALDHIFSAICRVIKLVVSQYAWTRSPQTGGLRVITEMEEPDDPTLPMTSNLNALLLHAVTNLGNAASTAALGVFESKMTAQTSPDLLRTDMDFIIELLDNFSEMTGRILDLSMSTKAKKTSDKKYEIEKQTLLREAAILTMLKLVLERSDMAQDAFRKSGGFEAIIRNTVCLEGYALFEEKDQKGDKYAAHAEALMRLLESSFGLISGATMRQLRGPSTPSKGATVVTEEVALASAAARNRHYLDQRGFYIDFSRSIAGTGILHSADSAMSILNLSLAFMDPSLKFEEDDRTKEFNQATEVICLRNADASRLLIGIARHLPSTETGKAFARRALDELLHLCGPEKRGTTLAQIASGGLCRSITDRKEFAAMFEDKQHDLYSRLVSLLRRLAAFSMSYVDFVAMLRSVAGPILKVESKDSRIRLPVISSSIRMQGQLLNKNIVHSEAWQLQEVDFCERLETLCVIAENGDRVARCQLGGDSITTISLYLEKVSVEDKLHTAANDGKLKYLEVECLDASTLLPGGMANAGTPATSSSSGERIWTPLATTGFSYSAWVRLTEPPSPDEPGSIFLFDISSPASSSTPSLDYMSWWYDTQHQCVTVLSSASHRHEPTCFPVSALRQGVWHHIILTYIPPKRPLLSRKAILGMYVDGRPLESEIRVESVNLPPNSAVHIGVPNPNLASSGHVRGSLPLWDLGPSLLISAVVTPLDATAMFIYGPDFEGMFWGDRPQRLSLAATGTAAFSMLAENGERGSVAGALRRRNIPKLEAAGTVTRERGNGPATGPESDSLSYLSLLLTVVPDQVIFGFRAASASSSMKDGWSSTSSGSSSGSKRLLSQRLENVARINSSNDPVSTDAIVYGTGSVVSPHGFADNVQWAGGPSIMMPIVNAARSEKTLALALRLIRASVHRHSPNLEMLQAGGGYKMLANLLRQNKVMDADVLDQCFAFAVHGFSPNSIKEHYSAYVNSGGSGVPPSWPLSNNWVFSDLDAMKYLMLNHQVWDMRNSGPHLPLRLLSFLNGLVSQKSAHKAFNSRRLHLLGIVRWTLHLMLEAAELYTLGEVGASLAKNSGDNDSDPSGSSGKTPRRIQEAAVANAIAAYNSGWYCPAPSIQSTSVGGDPEIDVLQACKALLRRVLTFMLTPGDLEAIAEAVVFTVSINPNTKGGTQALAAENSQGDNDKLMPGSVARVYLLRLIEELVVDGVNEIVASGTEKKGDQSEPMIQPHAGGGASTNQSYLSTAMKHGKLKPGADGSKPEDFVYHPKHQQAQAFISAFAGVLTPVWFACLLEGCHEEASASSALRLMILMLQSSPLFAEAFEEAGGFAPLVLSIPKYSTCPSITIAMLSQLLHAHILHLPCFAVLDASQLCEIFDAEGDSPELLVKDYRGGAPESTDPSCGIFALLAECLGRNIQLSPLRNELGRNAKKTNKVVLELLAHRHGLSPAFQDFCRTPDFLEPLAQGLCLVHDEKLQRMQQMERGKQSNISNAFLPETEAPPLPRQKPRRRGSLAEVMTDETPTERFVGRPEDDSGISGVGMVHLVRLVVSHAVLAGPLAAPLISALFRSFPIHASPEQVESFHLVLIEHCRSVVEDALQRGDPVALANCLGVSSVLLDRLMAGFFTSEPVLECVKIIMSALNCLTTTGGIAARALGSGSQRMLTLDAAHLGRFTCITALMRSRPVDERDRGDEDLKSAVFELIDKNIQSLLMVPASGPAKSRRESIMGGGGSAAFPAPPPSSKMYPLWLSASIARCSGTSRYPDLSVTDDPDRPFIVALMDEIHSALFDESDDLPDKAVSVVVSLLQQRRAAMSEMLITEVSRGDRIDTIDIMNRGGFGALLVAHEAASISETGRSGRSTSGFTQSTKRKYASFYEWLDRNSPQVEVVFNGIHNQALQMIPAVGAATPEDAIENEQKFMLLRLTSQDSSDRTILGGLARSELNQRCYEKTADNHLTWKRQGFDDLSSGAMQWKILLRQLKGSCSIWEGGSLHDEESASTRKRCLESVFSVKKDILPLEEKQPEIADDKKAGVELVTRWKLDLTESYERQRRRLLPNYEFHSLYNLEEQDESPGMSLPVTVREGEEIGSDDDSLDETTLSSGVTMKDDALRDAYASMNQRSGTMFSSTNMIAADNMANTDSPLDVATLLKELNLKTASRRLDDDDDYANFDENDTEVTSTVTSQDSLSEGGVSDSKETERKGGRPRAGSEYSIGVEELPQQPEEVASEMPADATDNVESEEPSTRDNVNASSFDLITGLLQAGDWPEKSYNVRRCTGLEIRKALLLWCRGAIYIIDGFEQTDGEGLEGRISRVEKEQSTFTVNLRTQNGDANEATIQKGSANTNKQKDVSEQDASQDVTYQHRSQRLSFADLYSVFRRRYELQQVGLELFDVHRSGTLVAFSSETDREEVLTKILNSPLPNSIFNSSYGTSINYKKFMNSWKTKIISQWVGGKMTNFDFLMHMNSFAGRTYNDLTQYPVFPWILSDYESEEIDLTDPSVYRDLSLSMGAQNEVRAQSFRDRYEALEDSYQHSDGVPPFHYGTHYSCAAYVLYYLMRLEPFSRMAMTLQGGHFDVADRLFHNIGSSWNSASSENVQDVRELIPEFFYLPEFLQNANNFDFGVTQSGKTIHDVSLPPWAKGDPRRFVRINRQALESDHVSKNLHQWIDLIFGYKQRGQEAVKALNVFMHVTYEGEVDLDALEDPVIRASTLAQIQNFGQTPSRLERRPFAPRTVFLALRDKNIDFGSLGYLTPLTPPFCVVGAHHRVHLRPTMTDTCKVGMIGQADTCVGDICMVKGQPVGVGRNCALILPLKRYYRYGIPNNGVSVHVASITSRQRELNKMLSVHDSMHRVPISAAKSSLNGQWLVTGCIDSTVRVWQYDTHNVDLRATLCGHEGGRITCIDVSTVFGSIVTGCTNGNVVLWDLRTLTFMRRLRHPFKVEADKIPGSVSSSPAVSVSINHQNGNVVTLVGSHLSVFDINGNRLATVGPGDEYGPQNLPSCAVSTDCPEWMELGIVAITGHTNGEIRLWGLNYDKGELVLRHLMPESPHTCAITAMRCEGERQDTLLVGDMSGRISVNKTLGLENFGPQELAAVTLELRARYVD